jgi:hypothetical protein
MHPSGKISGINGIGVGQRTQGENECWDPYGQKQAPKSPQVGKTWKRLMIIALTFEEEGE